MDTGSLVLYLKERGIEHTIFELDQPVATVEDVAKAGFDPAQDVKTLVLVDEHNEPLLAIIPGPLRLDFKKLCAAAGVQQVSFCAPEATARLTGYSVGGVPPVGHQKQLRTFADPKILEHEWVVGGGGSRTTLLKISPKVILEATEAVIVDITHETA
ncbi:MAG: aminoacyl-tRNA deacylase [Nanoarchaeota archaeon]|nr:aminoacyl-tRNA deacylase [Nanoarchaeota archaeon]